MNAGAWFVVACALVALIATIAGIVPVLRAAVALKRHAQAISPEALLAKAAAARKAAERLKGDLVLAELLLPRAAAAIDRMASALRVLRLAFAFKR